MISKQHKCIFIHIPKVAGESIEQFFLNLMGLKWKHRPLLLGTNGVAHVSAARYVSFKHATLKEFTSFYKFSFVRNPWDRVVSMFEYSGHRLAPDFKMFLFEHLKMRPQYKYLCDKDGRILVDYIGKFEHLQRDFDNICNHLNIQNTILPHRNKSNRRERRHYKEYYDSESIEFIAERYKVDIDMFGYTFNPPPSHG